MDGPESRGRSASSVSTASGNSLGSQYDDNEQGLQVGRKKLRRPLHTWSREDVTRWLRIYHSRYHKLYCHMFEYHELTGRALMRLDVTKLERIGITNSEHREDLLAQILRLQIKHQMKLLQKMQNQSPANNGDANVD